MVIVFVCEILTAPAAVICLASCNDYMNWAYIFVSLNGLLRVFIPGVREPRAGRPRKYEDGYYKAAKVLRILKENFIEWQHVKHEEGLSDDNAVVRYLLEYQKQLITLVIRILVVVHDRIMLHKLRHFRACSMCCIL